MSSRRFVAYDHDRYYQDEFCVTHQVKTQLELDTLLQDPEFHTPGKFRMIEFCLPQ
jgi:hypothetical protein